MNLKRTIFVNAGLLSSMAVIFLGLFSYPAAAELEGLAAPFNALVGMIKNDYIVFGVLFFLFFILLYSVFLGGLNTIPAFKSGEPGKYNKNAKIVALTLSGITVLSTFFVLGRTDVIEHAKRIASMFNLFFAVLLSVVLFFIVRHTFKGEGKIFGIDSKNLMSILSLALALYVFGTIGQSAWALGMGMTIFIITMIVVIIFALSGLGGGKKAPSEVGRAPYVPRGIDDVFGEQRERRLGDVSSYAQRAGRWVSESRNRELEKIKDEITEFERTLTDFVRANNIQDRYSKLERTVRANPTSDNERLLADFGALINAVNRIQGELVKMKRRFNDQASAGKQAIEAKQEVLQGSLERGGRGTIVDALEDLRDAIAKDQDALNSLTRSVRDLEDEWGGLQNRNWEQHIKPELERLGIA